MGDIVSQTSHTWSIPEQLDYKKKYTTPEVTNNTEKVEEPNRTDPKVCHDPAMKPRGIARMFFDQNKFNMENQELSTINEYDSTKIDAIEYPLISINNRNIEKDNIINMSIHYDGFLPTIALTIFDENEFEQRISSTQMSGLIIVVMVSPVDKVYKKILLNFRIYNADVMPYDSQRVTYYGEYYVPGFRDSIQKHIWMPVPCPKPITCCQGGHINANTWEMLHKIASETGLGFAATKQCKEIPDHIIRHIHLQRYNEYIEQQLQFSGTDKDNIFDAWVDLYGYIVMVNVPWVMNEKISEQELNIIANIMPHPTSNDMPDQKPKSVQRTLTDDNLLGTESNMFIESFTNDVDNSSVAMGTSQQIIPTSIVSNVCRTKPEKLDIQSHQNSVDGQHIEDYNTGFRHKIPIFHFNDDIWTELLGGYDINTQKCIRSAYFRKIRQSTLHVKLRTINFGLQRGTLVNVTIMEYGMTNTDMVLKSSDKVAANSTDIHEHPAPLPSEINQDDLTRDGNARVPNLKLSGLYYIDGMRFDYSPSTGKINQTLILIKKGPTSGLMNEHNGLGVVPDKPGKPTLPQGEPTHLEQNIVKG